MATTNDLLPSPSPSIKVTLDALLENTSGTPLEGKTIIFSYQNIGSTAWIFVGTALTNTEGHATITIELAPSTYNFYAVFAGDATYDSAYGKKLDVNIIENPTVDFTLVAPKRS